LEAIRNKAPLIIVDNTNTKFSDLSYYVSEASNNNCDFSIFQFHVDPQEAFERQKHGVPLKTLELMATRIWHERMPSTWKVYDVGRPWRPPTSSKDQTGPKDVGVLKRRGD